MAFMDKVQSLLNKVKPQQQEEQGVRSNRADGGFSGYQPKITRRKAEDAQPQQGNPVHGFTNMMPGGVDPSVMQRFQQVGGQTGAMPMQQGMPRQAAPQQPMNATGFQRPMQQTYQQQMPMPMQPPVQQTGYQRMPQQPAAPVQQMPQPPVQPQPQQQAAPRMQQVHQEGNMFFMPGSYVSQEGSVYRMVMRVAQITGVASCYRLIEFMQNNEAVIVNAEQITDVVEADRCMDLLFGAAYAMKQNFIRVSGKQIYLITPPQVQVQPFDSLRRMGQEDIERRWPGADRSQYQNAPQGFGTPARQDDFAGGFGRRAAVNQRQPGAYTDYGGFGVR